MLGERRSVFALGAPDTTMIIREYYRSAFWRKLSPPRSYALLLVAIFFTFSSIGYINDIWR